MAAAATRPSAAQVHAALILVQVIFGGGSVVGKLGVESFNPMLFALIREGTAGPLLLLCAFAKDGMITPQRQDVGIFIACGFFVFSNQAFFILGDKLAGPVIGSAWQCSQPIFTLLISLVLQWEKATPLKLIGIAVSFAGGAFMVCYGQSLQSQGAIGNILFALNCLGTSLYVIVGKLALRKYPALTFTAWSYLVASVMMAIICLCLNSQCQFVHFVCPPPSKPPVFHCDAYPTSCLAWHVPPSALLPLAYWIFFNSMLAYFLMTWGNKYAKPGFVLAYAPLQPFTSTVLTVLIILVLGASGTSLEMPGLNALGGIGVVAGLLLILRDAMQSQDPDHAREDAQRTTLIAPAISPINRG